MQHLMERKRAIFYIIIIALAVAAVTAMLTVFVMLTLQSHGDTAILNSEQYALWQKYQQVDEVRRTIDENYYNYNETGADVFQGAARGMVESLEDPYSTYMNADEYKQFNTNNSATYTGVGMSVSLDENGNTEIMRVYDGSPAQAAGIQPGDIIAAVDGEDVLGIDLQLVVNKIRAGEPGSNVDITLVRGGELLTVTAQRNEIEISRVEYMMLEYSGAKLGYLLLTEFNGNCVAEFAAALEDLSDQGAQGVVLDLRNNPGGYLHSCVEIADMLLPEGLIVYTQDRDGQRIEYKSEASSLDIPLVVLVNGNSASASEILAGALQDHKRAQLVGEQTYGKALVQDIFPLEETELAAVRLTVASYFTPSGRMINGEGLTPDEVVPLDESLSGQIDVSQADDNQLQSAIQILAQSIGQGAVSIESGDGDTNAAE